MGEHCCGGGNLEPGCICGAGSPKRSNAVEEEEDNRDKGYFSFHEEAICVAVA